MTASWALGSLGFLDSDFSGQKLYRTGESERQIRFGSSETRQIWCTPQVADSEASFLKARN